ncbi:hypothetical protein ACFY3K_00540 [Staphylococcus capitis]
MRYLIKTTTHEKTGEIFRNVIKIKDNKDYTIVKANSKDEAIERIEDND